MAEKEAGIHAMVAAIRQLGGEVHIADFARQRSRLIRTLLVAVGWVDGRENTRANANGAIEAILGSVSQAAADPIRSLGTPFGEMSLFKLEV